jgi:hypothetical protein
VPPRPGRGHHAAPAAAGYEGRYSFEARKPLLEGTYYSLDPRLGTPAVFDGEFSPAETRKK